MKSLLKQIYFDFFKKVNNSSFFNLVLAFLFLIYVTYRILILVSYSPDIVIGEDNNVWNIQKMLLGNPLYTNPEDYPFEIFQYAPLSQYLTFFLAKIFALKAGINVYEIFVLGRILSLIFNFFTSFVIYKFCKLFFNISNNVNLVLSYFSFVIITYIDYTLRADSLSNLFVMISIFYFFKSIITDQNKYILYNVFFALMAIFSKQSAFQVVVYFFVLYLLINFKQWLKFLLILALVTSVFCLFFYLIYGEVFFQSTIGGISNPTEIRLGISLFFDYTKRFGILLFVSILMFFIKGNLTDVNYKFIKILLFIFISSFIFSFGTSQKIGAGLNYYTLNIYISIILTSIFVDKLLNTDLIKYKYFFLISIMLFSSFNILFDRMYNRHYSQISLKHKKEYFIDSYFVKMSKKIIGKARGQDFVFSPNKNIKNLYFYNTVLPNTEYYYASHFNLSKFDKRKLIYVMINENDTYDINNRTFKQFNIDLSDYSILFEYKNRKLLRLKKRD